MNVAEQLKSWKIDTSSFSKGVRSYKKLGYNTKHEFDDFILDVVGKPIPTKGVKEAEIMCGYVVQEAIRLACAGVVPTNDLVIETAKQKCAEWFEKNPWSKEPEGQQHELQVAAAGNLITNRSQRAPRGSGLSKKERSVALYKQHKDKTRKELVQLFVDELGLTPPGASTYVHNCKSGLWK